MTIAISQLEKNGRFPPLEIQIQRVVERDGQRVAEDTAYLREFLSYRFTQSMLIPVDAFSFTFVPPSYAPGKSLVTIDELTKEGDIVTVWYGPDNDRRQIATGLIDSTSLRCTLQGESFGVVGRDLLGQLEDQDAVSFGPGKTETYWGPAVGVKSVVRGLIKQTRIADTKIKLQGISDDKALFATSPGESKLSALLRYLEPLNALVWLEADGTIMVGKPDFRSVSSGTFFVDRKNEQANCTMSVNKNAGRIPNGVLGIWSGGEFAQDAFATDLIENNAERCSELRKAGHIINKTVVVSVPSTDIKSGSSDLTTLSSKGAEGYVKAYVKRLIARANLSEVDVEVIVPGHCNDDGDPYVADTIYKIYNDRGNIDEDMYCYAVDYFMDKGGGQTTALHFCKLGTIVADADAP